MSTFFLMILLLIIFIVVILLLYYLISKKIKDTDIKIPIKISNEGIKIPLITSYSGFGFLGLSKNNLFPLLRVYNDYLEYKVLFRKRKNYSEIDEVDYYQMLMPVIVIKFKKDTFNFTAELYRKENLIELLKFFKRKNIPLSAKAKDLI